MTERSIVEHSDKVVLPQFQDIIAHAEKPIENVFIQFQKVFTLHAQYHSSTSKMMIGSSFVRILKAEKEGEKIEHCSIGQPAQVTTRSHSENSSRGETSAKTFLTSPSDHKRGHRKFGKPPVPSYCK